MNNKGEKTDILSGLKKSSLFQHLSEPELSTVSLISSLNKFERGAALFSQGDRGGDVFIIVSGSVDVFIHQGIENKKKIATYKKGDFFGELAFFLKDIRIGTALACEKTTVVVKSFYIIVSGAVLIIKSFEIDGKEKHGKIALIPPGRPLGHLSFFDNSERSATAIACERTTLMEIELSTYNELVCTVSDETDVAFELLEGFIDDLAVAMVNTNRALVYASSQAGLN